MQTKQKVLADGLSVTRLSRLESDHGLSQREVAASIGMPEQTYSNKKNGIGGRKFTLKDVTALADFFGVSVDYLLGRIDTPWPDPWEKNGKEAER